ncbi:MAG TPA: hypothetical protein VK084_00870 [Chitinophagaceae bacterium]|nr:hypothetical protein [Chitinophagaceae bacterium]
MKKRIVISIITLCLTTSAFGQKRFFDPINTGILVNKAIRNYDYNTEGAKKQTAIAVDMEELKRIGNKCKDVFDKLNNKVKDLYIVVADVYTASKITKGVVKCFTYQKEILHWVTKKPWLAVVYYDYEAKIINNAQSLIELCTMCVATYGTISKMSVANRRIVYARISNEIQKLVVQSGALAGLCEWASKGEALKNAKILRPYFNDKEAVEEIVKEWNQK